MLKVCRLFFICNGVVLLMGGGLAVPRCEAAGTPAQTVSDAEVSQPAETDETDEIPILDQLAKGMDLLHEQLDKQRAELKTATTDRERRLIRDQLSFLRQELRELEQIVHQLAGPRFDARAAAQEQQSEREAEREEKVLEQRRLTP